MKLQSPRIRMFVLLGGKVTGIKCALHGEELNGRIETIKEDLYR